MKTVAIIFVSFLLALIVYATYSWIQGKNKSLSPIPEDGVKVIQVSPDKK